MKQPYSKEINVRGQPRLGHNLASVMELSGARLYTDLADWYHLLTTPEDAAEEAEFFLRLFTEALGAPPR